MAIAADIPDDEECAAGNERGQGKAGSALLQAKRHIANGQVSVKRHIAATSQAPTDVSATGAGAPLTETGYMIVAAQCCNYEMQEYIRRVAVNEGLQVCNEGGLKGITPYFSCQAGPQTLAKLKEDLHANVGWKCPFVDYPSGNCALAHSVKASECPPIEPEHPDIDCGCVRTDSVKVDFFGSTLTHSNLNGVGPDAGAQNIVYTNVGTYNGQVLDLILTSDANYQKSLNPNATNGKNGKFGTINFRGGVTSELTFTVVKTGTTTPQELNEVHFSFFDLDQSFVGKMKERVYVPFKSFNAFVVNKDVEFVISRTATGDTAFMSTQYGVGCDNPSDPEALGSKTCTRKDGTQTIDQRKRSFMLVYRKASSWKVTVEITCDPVVTGGDETCDSGRNMLFAGTSSLRDRCES